MHCQDRALLDYLNGFISERRLRRFEEVLALRTRYVTLVLEDIYQSHNISAVLRSCDAFGVQDVHILEGNNPFRFSPEITQGTEKWLSIYRYAEVGREDCIEQLKSRGYRIIVTSPHTKAATPETLDLSERLAIVIGNETSGVSERFSQAADGNLVIPMVGFVESLNLSVASAICLERLTRRLRDPETGPAGWHLTEDEKDQLRLEWARATVPNAAAIERRFCLGPSCENGD